jgi:hypothetical protein
MATGSRRWTVSNGSADSQHLNGELHRIEEHPVRAAEIIEHMRIY